MDAIISLPTSKTRMVLIEQNVGQGQDLISKLPDNILLHIFSFLPIIDVLRTSVLSTRWKYLWTSISDIDFDETRYNLGLGLGISFLDSIERVMLLHDPSCIKKFRLRLNMSVSASRVVSWVSAAMSHKVQELDLSLPLTTLFELPDSLFTSDTLSILRLKMGVFFKVPSFIHFSNLRALCLKVVVFRGDQSSELFSGCPVLEKLVLYKCIWKETKRITISIPSLRTLTIYHPRSLYHSCDGFITIYAEKLLSLKCISCLAVGLIPCNLPSLIDAYIDEATVSVKYLKQEFARRAIKLIGEIRNVKSLTVTNDTFQCLAFEENFQACPLFHSLTHLKVISGWRGYTNDQVLMHFLKNSPNLESLEIPQVFHNNGWLLKVVPECFTSCLNTVSILYFEGKIREVSFLKYLLRNANMLERVTIFCPEDLASDLDKQKEIHRQLQAIHCCDIEFCKSSSNW